MLSLYHHYHPRVIGAHSMFNLSIMLLEGGDRNSQSHMTHHIELSPGTTPSERAAAGQTPPLCSRGLVDFVSGCF